MMTRYQAWMQANPLRQWLIGVAAGLALARVSAWALAVVGPSGQATLLLLTGGLVMQPTFLLLINFSEQGRRERPVTPAHERGVGLVSLVVCGASLGLLVAALLGRGLGWPVGTRSALLFAFLMAALVSGCLGYAARRTGAGRWAVRLTVAWVLLMVAVVLARVLWGAAGRA